MMGFVRDNIINVSIVETGAKAHVTAFSFEQKITI